MTLARVRRVDERHLSFECPGCGNRHVVNVGEGNPSWEWNGDVNKPTLSPSLLVRGGHYAPGHKSSSCWCTYNEEKRRAGQPESPFGCYICHSFVRDGLVQFLHDCTHELAGQTVALPVLSGD